MLEMFVTLPQIVTCLEIQLVEPSLPGFSSRIQMKVVCNARLAGEADGRAREVQPKAVQALEGLKKQVQEWQGAGPGTSAKDLHSLASSRLAAWCAMHVNDATSYQACHTRSCNVRTPPK